MDAGVKNERIRFALLCLFPLKFYEIPLKMQIYGL